MFHLRSRDRRLSGMVSRYLFTLITVLMFLVNNDQSQIRKWCKKRRSRSDHHIQLTICCPLHLIVPLTRRHPGMHHRHTGTKYLIKAHHRLPGQCNLRYEYDRLSALCCHRPDHFHIYFRLAASGHAMYQVSAVIPSQIFPLKLFNCLLLFRRIPDRHVLFPLLDLWVPVLPFRLHPQHTLIFQCTHYRCGHMKLFHCQTVIHFRSV